MTATTEVTATTEATAMAEDGETLDASAAHAPTGAVAAPTARDPRKRRRRLKLATTADLEHIELEAVMGDTARKFPAKELWKETGAVLMLVRRPGCPMCRRVVLVHLV